MATARCLLALCLLTWAAAYTDCTSGNNSTLNVSGAFLTPQSPYPTDQIFLTFNVSNPSPTEDVTVQYLYWTLNFSTPIVFNITFDPVLVVASGTANKTLLGNILALNQLYSTGTIPFQLAFYSNWSTEVACSAGSVAISTPPTQVDLLGGSQVNVSALALKPASPQLYENLTLSFEVENAVNKTVAFNAIVWTITFNASDTPLGYTENLGTAGVSLAAGATQDVTGTPVNQTQAGTLTWFVYTLDFKANGTQIANWKGWGTLTSAASYLYFLGLAGLSFLFMS